MTVEDHHFHPGARWASKDGKRTVVVEYLGGSFLHWCDVRNIATGRVSQISRDGLVRKFRPLDAAAGGEA